LDDLEKDMKMALALMERDFPVGKQVSIVFIVMQIFEWCHHMITNKKITMF